MKTKLISIAAVVTAAMLIASCSDDNNMTSVSPVFKELTIESQPIYTGQYAYAKVSYSNPGAYIYSSEYSYSVDQGNSETWTVTDPTKQEPNFKFKVPDSPGTYKVTFKAAKIRYSSTDANGAIYGSANSVTSTFRVQAADVIDACWGDTRVHIDSVLAVSDTLDGRKMWKGTVRFSSAEDADVLPMKRIYGFSTDNKLVKVEETATYELGYVRQYEDALDGYKYDSIQNWTALSSIVGLTNMEGYTKDNSSITLTGSVAHLYPVDSWTRLTTPRECANVVNAFWSGQLEKYSCTLYSEKTVCVASVWCENDKIIFNRTYTKL